MNEFICTWDKTVIISTVIITLIIFAISVFMIIVYTKRYKKHGKNHGFVIAVLIFSYILFCMPIYFAFFTTTKISLTADQVIVNQVKGKTVILISEISEIREISNNDMANTLRTNGSSGLFGYWGKFENQQLGKFRMYATNSQNLFLIKTKKQTYVLSCNNYKNLIQQLNNQINNQ